ncbi:hypothetical protein Fcan01_01658 [Folsomia candida]|uniref:Uncharacterized protein n=1 Tax=Folsomia candida TaxID=158441 RepID=A0A226F0V8_FOLCA|nr:hypothetical protein Fcan01_01658 [Folsomia candida]
MHSIKIVIIVVLASLSSFLLSDATATWCLVPRKCNNGTYDALSNPFGSLACTTACQQVCGYGSTGLCQSFEGTTELLGPKNDARPTSATCQCSPAANMLCKANVTSLELSTANLFIFPTTWCASCNATGVTNCFFDPAKYRFRCDCVYSGFKP